MTTYNFKGDVPRPARRCITVTPIDSGDLGLVTRAIFVSAQGDVTWCLSTSPTTRVWFSGMGRQVRGSQSERAAFTLPERRPQI
jgi:hypothetical protein